VTVYLAQLDDSDVASTLRCRKDKHYIAVLGHSFIGWLFPVFYFILDWSQD
jgi:disulfide bond formation protein DsbB